VAAGLALAAGAARAQAPASVDVEVMVSQISDSPGAIDPRAGKLDASLQREFRYGSLKVLQSQRLHLALDQVGSLPLPNGSTLRVRPLQVDDRGVLLAVAVPGAVQTDLRVQNGKMVVIGAGRYEDGKLVISFEPHW
jgi:hypothetical protein